MTEDEWEEFYVVLSNISGAIIRTCDARLFWPQ